MIESKKRRLQIASYLMAALMVLNIFVPSIGFSDGDRLQEIGKDKVENLQIILSQKEGKGNEIDLSDVENKIKAIGNFEIEAGVLESLEDKKEEGRVYKGERIRILVAQNMPFGAPISGSLTQGEENIGTYRFVSGKTLIENGELNDVLEYKKHLYVEFIFSGDIFDDNEVDGDKIRIGFGAEVSFEEMAKEISAEGDTIEFYNKVYKFIGKNSTVRTVTKTGTADLEKQEIEWTVELKNEINSEAQSLAGFQFSDDLSTVGDYVEKTFVISGVSEYGTINDSAWTKGIDFTFADTTTAGNATIKFRTKIPDNHYYAQGNQKITNKALMKPPGEDVEITGTGEVPFSQNWIEKYGSTSIKDGYIVWEIIVNQDKKSLTNAKVKDILPSNTDEYLKDNKNESKNLGPLIAEKYEVFVANADGTYPDAAKKSGTELPAEISLGDITTPVKIVIETKIPTSDTAFGVVHYTNKATLLADQIPTTVSGITTDATVGVGLSKITKTATGKNQSLMSFDWKIQVEKQNKKFVPVVFDAVIFSNNDLSDTSLSHALTKETFVGKGISYPASSSDLKAEIEPSEQVKAIAKSIFTEHGAEKVPVDKDTKTVKGWQVASQIVSASAKKGTIAIYPLILNTKTVGQLMVYTGTDDAEDDTINITTQLVSRSLQFNTTNSNNEVFNTAYLAVNEGKEIASVSSAYNRYLTGVIWKNTVKADFHNLDGGDNDMRSLRARISPGEGLGSYNYNDNSIIYAISINTYGVNYAALDRYAEDGLTKNAYKDKEFTITDTLPDGWEFVNITDEKKFLIYPAGQRTDQNSNSAAAHTASKTVSEATPEELNKYNFRYNFPSDEKGKSHFYFTNLDRAFVIFVKAKPTAATLQKYIADAKQTEVFNNIAVNVKDLENATKDYSHANSIVDYVPIKKSFDNKTYESYGYAQWNIDFIPYNVKFELTEGIKELYLKDKMSKHLEPPLDTEGNIAESIKIGEKQLSSFEIVKLTVDKNGKGVETTEQIPVVMGYDRNSRTNENVIYDKASNTIYFYPRTNDGTAYRLKYITTVDGSIGEEVSNSVELVGTTIKTQTIVEKFEIYKAYADASRLHGAKITINKISTKDDAKVKGVTFSVYKADAAWQREETVFRAGVTDENGVLVISKLHAKSDTEPQNYILKETAAPGYIIDGTEYKIQVTRNSDGSSKAEFIDAGDKVDTTDKSIITLTNEPENNGGNNSGNNSGGSGGNSGGGNSGGGNSGGNNGGGNPGGGGGDTPGDTPIDDNTTPKDGGKTPSISPSGGGGSTPDDPRSDETIGEDGIPRSGLDSNKTGSENDSNKTRISGAPRTGLTDAQIFRSAYLQSLIYTSAMVLLMIFVQGDVLGRKRR